MPNSRLLRILTLVGEAAEGTAGTTRLCEVSAEIVAVTGAGIMLMAGEVRGGSLCSSDAVSARIEDLQYTLGEGPCVDAYEQDRPVLEPDLGAGGTGRWVAFGPPAVQAGARAVFGFPLQVGTVRLGALNLYSARPGPLTDMQHGDALILAGVVSRSILAMQAHAPPGAIAAELEAGADLRFVVHQASGVLSARFDISISDALIRLRAYAFANDRLLVHVAEDVVARRLRLE